MAKSLPQILEQIERLQREAQTMQTEVVKRIRKEIAHFRLTPEQLFADASPVGRVAKAIRATSRAVVKYADGMGNTWGGMGKRPTWLRQALEAGRQLEEFLVGKHAAPAQTKVPAKKRGRPGRKPGATAAVKPARKATAAKKAAAKPAAKKAAAKPAAKKAAAKRAPRKRAAAAPAAAAPQAD